MYYKQEHKYASDYQFKKQKTNGDKYNNNN